MSLAYQLQGNGDHKVIVLNDWSQDVTSYDPTRPYLDESALSFAFVDVRGYGASMDKSGEYTAAEIVADITELADELGWAKFSLVGHSMTGIVVQLAMAEIPDRLVSVVATTPVPATSLNADAETLAFFASMATDDDAFKQGVTGLTSSIYGDSWCNYKLSRNRATVATEAMQGYCEMWGTAGFADRVEGLETPILVIFGSQDIELLRSDSTLPLFQQWYPNLTTHTSQCGHYPMQEVPVEFAHVVQNYLVSHS